MEVLTGTTDEKSSVLTGILYEINDALPSG